MRSVYLAGPDVFLPNAKQVGKRKVDLCTQHGFRGLFPLDNELDEPPGGPRAHGLAIYGGNVEMMRRADVILANLSPFRGPSADVGTVFEVGFFAGLGRPVFAYSNDSRGFAERTRDSFGLDATASVDKAGLSIERFDLQDNLMLPGAVTASGGSWVSKESKGTQKLAAFEAFEEVLVAMRGFADSRPTLAVANR